MIEPVTRSTAQRQDPGADRKKALLFALLALLLFGAALAFKRVRSAGSRETVARHSTTGPAEPAAMAGRGGETHLSPPMGQELSLEQLLEVLAAEVQTPTLARLSQRFVEAFMAEPELKAVLDQHRGPAGKAERISAAGFMEKLRRTPAFRRLSGQFLEQPEGRSALSALAQNPLLDPLVRKEQRAASADAQVAQDPRRGRSAVLVGGGVPSGHRSALSSELSGLVGGLMEGGGVGGGERGSAGFAAGPSPASGVPAPESGGGGERIDGVRTDRAERGAGAEGSAPRAPPAGDGTSAWLRPKDDSPTVCTRLTDPGCQPAGTGKPETMDQAIRDWLRRHGIDPNQLLKAVDDWGLWGSCFALNLLEKCDRACKSPPDRFTTLGTLSCRKPSRFPEFPYFAACLEWKGSTAESECLGLCKSQAPCQNPPDILAKYCGSPTLCTDNRQTCEAAGLIVAGPDRTCPYGAAALTHNERCGKPGILAYDCQSLDDNLYQVKNLCPDDLITDECRHRWVESHEKELGVMSPEFLAEDSEVIKSYRNRAECNGNWACANAAYVKDRNLSGPPQ